MKGSDVVIEGVYKSFGNFKALSDINLAIKKGEFFSLLGPSGCGKTTLLRILAGFETPDDGEVTFDGIDVLSLPPNRRQANTIFQNYALFPHLTVFENVAFSLRLKKLSKSEINAKVEKYLELVQLSNHAPKKPNQLSVGQKQRVAIARALINEPNVLLLDEPLSALDAKLRQHMLMELDEIHDKIGITFIYVTHDQQEALSVSDRIAVMNLGNVLQVGTPHDIYESPATDFVARFIGETNLFDATVCSVEKQTNSIPIILPSMDIYDPVPIVISPIREEETVYMAELDIPELGKIKVTTVDEIKPGQKVSFTIRPEKIVISKEKPTTKRADINLFQGAVDDPIYSGFQTKFYVKVGQTIIRVIKQHAKYYDEGPEIVWKDNVYLSWSAHDGYIVGVKES